MRASPGLPGSGADPLFTLVFAVAALVNLGVAFVAAADAGRDRAALRRATRPCCCGSPGRAIVAGRQRRADLEAFKAVHRPTEP